MRLVKIALLTSLGTGAFLYLYGDLYAKGIHSLLASCTNKFSMHEHSEQTAPVYAEKMNLLKSPLPESGELGIDNSDGLADVIVRNAPILYLNQTERYLPITAEEYFLGSESSVMERNYVSKHKKTVIDSYELTNFEPLYELRKNQGIEATSKHYNKNMYMHIGERVKFGSDPKNYCHPTKTENGFPVLSTPVYVMTFEQHGNLYIQYLFLYGYNGPYHMPLPGKKIYINPHEGDFEHFTVELDKETHQVKRYFYAEHEVNEGLKLYPHQISYVTDDVGVEHPLVFIARGSHASYPREGVYVRLVGIGNDATRKEIRWEPKLIRVYQNADQRFDPKTMGWLYFPGYYGERGVKPAYAQEWFGNIDGDIVEPRIFSVRFCEHEKWLRRNKEGLANSAELLVLGIKTLIKKGFDSLTACFQSASAA